MRCSPTENDLALVVGAALVLVTVVALSRAGLSAHQALLSQHNDLGNHLQALAAAADGDLSMPQSNTIDGVVRSRFAVHSNWILWPASVLWRLWPTPAFFLLFAVAAAAMASVAMGLAVARHGVVAGVLAATVVILHPWVHDAVLSDGHLTTWAAAFVAAAFGLRHRRPRLALACAVIALTVKEDMPAVGLAASAVLAIEGERRGASFLALASVVMLLVDAITLRVAGGPIATDRFDWLATTTMPTLLAHLTDPAILRLPLFVLLSGGLLAGRGARWLLPTVPIIGLCMLDDGAYMTRLAGTYYLPLVVVFVVAAVDAGIVAGASVGRLWGLAGITIASSAALSTLPTLAQARPRPELVAAVHRLVESRGLGGARLCVQNNLGPWLDPRAPVVAFPHCRPDDPRLFLLRATAPDDDGLTLRTDTASLLGAPLPVVLDELDRLTDQGAEAVHDDAGVWLFIPPAPSSLSTTGPAAVPPAWRDAVVRDVARFTGELAERRMERAPLAEGLVRLAVGGKT